MDCEIFCCCCQHRSPFRTDGTRQQRESFHVMCQFPIRPVSVYPDSHVHFRFLSRSASGSVMRFKAHREKERNAEKEPITRYE